MRTVFRRLDAAAFESPAGCSRAGLPEGSAIAVDGKALRGIHGQELPRAPGGRICSPAWW